MNVPSKGLSDNRKSAIQNLKSVGFLTILALLVGWAGTAQAQQPGKVPRIGFLITSSPSAIAPRMDAFPQGLHELGYAEGKNISLRRHRHHGGAGACVRRHHHANLVVMSVAGAPNMTGPSEAAFVVNELVRPNSVIVTHVNEAATVNGKIVSTSRAAAFQKAATMPVHVPLSGRTMEFDGNGRCVSGC